MLKSDDKLSTRLTEVVETLLADNGTSDDLLRALDETRSRLRSLEDEFSAAVESEPEGIRLAVQAEIYGVRQSFSDYQSVLTTLDGYLAEFDTDFLEDALRNLPLAIERLNLDFFRYREAVMAEWGPSTHPGINHLLGLMSSSDYDEDSRFDALEQQRELEVIRVEASLDSLSEDPTRSCLEPSSRKFLEQYLHLINLEDFGSETWQQSLIELGKAYTRIDVDFLGRRYGQGPTAVSQINMVINTAWLFQRSVVDREVVAYYLEQAESSLQQILAGHLQMQRGLAEEERHYEDANLVSDGCEAMLACIEEYWTWLENPSDEALQKLYIRASEAAEDVQEGFRSLSAVETDAINCSICGSSNRPELAKCRSCGSVLATVAEASFSVVEGGNPVEDRSALAGAARFQTVLTVAEQLINQLAKPEALLEECDQLTIALELAKKSNRSAEQVQTRSDDEQEMVQQAARDYSRGMVEMAEAIVHLRSLAVDPSHEKLERARELLTSVAECLAEVQQTLAPLNQN
jgi:hypothetical protein